MRIGLGFRNELMGLPGGAWIVDQFDAIIARIAAVWGVEHYDDGRHKAITADSVVTDDLTVNEQFSATSLRASTFVRIGSANPSLPGVVLRQSAGALQVFSNDGTSPTTVNAFKGSFLNSSGARTGATVTTGTFLGDALTFPATQVPSSDANTLDDYEEGAWTPADGSGAGLSFTVSDARYIKIGKFVSATARVIYPVTADTSNAAISGLPAPALNSATACYGGHINWQNGTAAHLVLLINDNSDDVMVFEVNVGRKTNADLSGVELRFTVNYEADA